MSMNDQQALNCYGCTLADLERLKDDVLVKMDPLMTAMGMASDAQEELARGMFERARQTLNRQKWLLAQIHKKARQRQEAIYAIKQVLAESGEAA